MILVSPSALGRTINRLKQLFFWVMALGRYNAAQVFFPDLFGGEKFQVQHQSQFATLQMKGKVTMTSNAIFVSLLWPSQFARCVVGRVATAPHSKLEIINSVLLYLDLAKTIQDPHLSRRTKKGIPLLCEHEKFLCENDAMWLVLVDQQCFTIMKWQK